MCESGRQSEVVVPKDIESCSLRTNLVEYLVAIVLQYSTLQHAVQLYWSTWLLYFTVTTRVKVQLYLETVIAGSSPYVQVPERVG